MRLLGWAEPSTAAPGTWAAWEALLEGEGVGRRAVGAEVVEALVGLGDAGDVAGGHPPEHERRLAHVLEPFAAAAEDLDVVAVVGVLEQRLG